MPDEIASNSTARRAEHVTNLGRLKLGQLLLKWDPREARAVLEAFVAEYPASDWRDRAEYLLAEAEALLQRQPNS